MTGKAVEVSDLTEIQARVLIDRIKSSANSLREDFTRLRDSKGWIPAGYPSWKALVETEFGMSVDQANRLVKQTQVIEELSSAAKTEVEVSARAAEVLSPVLDEVADEVREATKGKRGKGRTEAAQEVVDEALAKSRARAASTLSEQDKDEPEKKIAPEEGGSDPLKTLGITVTDVDLIQQILKASKKAKMPAYDWVILAVREKLSAIEEDSSGQRSDTHGEATVPQGLATPPRKRAKPRAAGTASTRGAQPSSAPAKPRVHAINCPCGICKPVGAK